MPETLTAASPLVAPLAAQFGFAQWAAIRNLEDITDEEAIVLPEPGGNSINWIAGHIIAIRQRFLQGFDVAPFLSAESWQAYTRGSKPAAQMPETLTTLRELLTKSHEALVGIVSRLDEDGLAAKAPFSPGNDPNETVGSLLGKLVVHESYHAGQLGMSRRLVGKPGAIQ